MKLSEYIEKLQAIRNVEGDVEVVIATSGGLEGMPAVKFVTGAPAPVVVELLIQTGAESDGRLILLPGKRIDEQKRKNYPVVGKGARIA